MDDLDNEYWERYERIEQLLDDEWERQTDPDGNAKDYCKPNAEIYSDGSGKRIKVD